MLDDMMVIVVIVFSIIVIYKIEGIIVFLSWLNRVKLTVLMLWTEFETNAEIIGL